MIQQNEKLSVQNQIPKMVFDLIFIIFSRNTKSCWNLNNSIESIHFDVACWQQKTDREMLQKESEMQKQQSYA